MLPVLFFFSAFLIELSRQSLIILTREKRYETKRKQLDRERSVEIKDVFMLESKDSS